MAVATEQVAERFLNIVANVPIAVNFPLYEDDEVFVYYGSGSILAAENVDYTVVLSFDFETFTITPTTVLLDKINALIALDSTEINYITVRRTLDYITSSTASLCRDTRFISREFDRTAMRFQQIAERLNRSVSLPPGSVGESDNPLVLFPGTPDHVAVYTENGVEPLASPLASELSSLAGLAAGRALVYPPAPALPVYDAVNRRIRRVGAARDIDDAVTLRQLFRNAAFASARDFIDDFTVGYAGSGSAIEVTDGDYIDVGHNDLIVTSADDYHVENAAGVRAYVNKTEDGFYPAEAFGVRESNADNTTIFDRMVSVLPSGSKILYPPKSTIRGHFLSPEKAFFLDLNESLLVNTVDNQPIIAMGRHATTDYDVVETTLPYGTKSFTVLGASAIFHAGGIVTLWDGARRPTDNAAVNQETVRIKSVVGDVVNLDGHIMGHQGVQDGAIKATYSPTVLRGAGVVNGRVRPEDTHFMQVVSIWRSEGAVYRKLESENTTGTAFDMRFSMDPVEEWIKCSKPRQPESGGGYGLQNWSVTGHRVRHVYGSGMRHIYDQDNAYNFDIFDVQEEGAVSTPVVLSHNGFCSHGSFRKYRGVATPTGKFAVGTGGIETFSTGSLRPLAKDHPSRDILIDDVYIYFPTPIVPGTPDSYGVYLQNDWSGKISNIVTHFETATAPISATGHVPVRIIGVPIGGAIIENITTNSAARMMVIQDRAGGSDAKIITSIRGLNCTGTVHSPILVQGAFGFSLDEMSIAGITADSLIHLQSLNGTPFWCALGPSIRSDAEKIWVTSSVAAGVPGSKAQSIRNTSGMAVANGDGVPASLLQNADARLNLVPPSGPGTITLSATSGLPPPYINGAKCDVIVPSGRNDVNIPAGNNLHVAITVASGSTTSLISYAGKWAALRQ